MLARSGGAVIVAYLVAAGLLSGCPAIPRTQLVVVVRSTLDIPADIDAIVLRVTTPTGREPLKTGAPLVGAMAVALPATFGLELKSGPAEPLGVEVAGELNGDEVVLARAITGFVRGETRMLELELTRECMHIPCSLDQTCTAGACVDAHIPATTLPLWPGSVPPSDAGTDVNRLDGGAGDAGDAPGDAGDAGDAGDIVDAPVRVPVVDWIYTAGIGESGLITGLVETDDGAIYVAGQATGGVDLGDAGTLSAGEVQHAFVFVLDDAGSAHRYMEIWPSDTPGQVNPVTSGGIAPLPDGGVAAAGTGRDTILFGKMNDDTNVAMLFNGRGGGFVYPYTSDFFHRTGTDSDFDRSTHTLDSLLVSSVAVLADHVNCVGGSFEGGGSFPGDAVGGAADGWYCCAKGRTAPDGSSVVFTGKFGGDGDDAVTSVAALDDGSLAVGGYYVGSNARHVLVGADGGAPLAEGDLASSDADRTGLVARINPDGTLGWMVPMEAQALLGQVNAVVPGTVGAVVAGGSFVGAYDGVPLVVHGVITSLAAANGDPAWRVLAAAGPTYVKALARAAAGPIYAGGSFSGDAGAIGNQTLLPAPGTRPDSLWLAAIEPADGAVPWVLVFGSSGESSNGAIAASRPGEEEREAVLVAGTFSGVLHLADQTATVPESYELAFYVARLHVD